MCLRVCVHIYFFVGYVLVKKLISVARKSFFQFVKMNFIYMKFFSCFQLTHLNSIVSAAVVATRPYVFSFMLLIPLGLRTSNSQLQPRFFLTKHVHVPIVFSH